MVTVVFNDGAYGNVRRMQEEDYAGRVIATDLGNPDFVRLAESFGAVGVRAETPQELGLAVKEGLQRAIPTIIETPVGRFPNPWSLLYPQGGTT